VVVAVVAVAMVQAPLEQVVVVVAVRHKLVAAAFVAAGALDGLAGSRVHVADRHDMLVVVALVGSVQMPIVQVIDVVAVLDAGVTAVLAMHMGVLGVGCVAHGIFAPCLVWADRSIDQAALIPAMVADR
jgi:hypothetical protein